MIVTRPLHPCEPDLLVGVESKPLRLISIFSGDALLIAEAPSGGWTHDSLERKDGEGQRRWFQSASKVAPHYDLTPSRRQLAVAAGAIELTRREAVAVWKARRALLSVAGHPAAFVVERLS